MEDAGVAAADTRALGSAQGLVRRVPATVSAAATRFRSAS